jgi:hypothetical protein
VNTEFGYWEEVADWPAAIKLVMVWGHTCRLFSVFKLAGAGSRDLAQIFRSYPQPMGTDILQRDPNYWNDVIHPHRLNREVFLTHGVSSVLSDKDPKTLENLNFLEIISNYAFAQDADVKVIYLMRDPLLTINGTGTFLSGDRAKVLSPIIGKENAEGVSSSNLESMVRKAIEDLEQNPYQKSWATINAIVRDLPIYPSLRERLKALLEQLDVDGILKTDLITAYQALRVAASQIPHFQDDDLRKHYEASLIQAAYFLSEKYKGDSMAQETIEGDVSLERHVAELMDISLALSIRLNDSRSTSMGWSKLIRSMLSKWPQLGKHISNTFSQVVFELPAKQLHGMWAVVLSLRASQPDSL